MKVQQKQLVLCLLISLVLIALFLIGVGKNAPTQIDSSIEELGFSLSGTSGDWNDISINSTVVGVYDITYTPRGDQGWGSAYWLYPSSNWGDQPGRDLRGTGYKKVTFDAKSDKPGQNATFIVGGITGKQFIDSMQPARFINVVLQPTWKTFTIDLAVGSDSYLSCVIGGFGYQGEHQDGVSTIHIKNIAYS